MVFALGNRCRQRAKTRESCSTIVLSVFGVTMAMPPIVPPMPPKVQRCLKVWLTLGSLYPVVGWGAGRGGVLFRAATCDPC